MTDRLFPSDAPYAHLNDAAREQVNQADQARIYAIREGTWLGYKDAKRVIERMEELLDYAHLAGRRRDRHARRLQWPGRQGPDGTG